MYSVFFSSSFSAIFGLSESVSVFYFIPLTPLLAILFCIYVSSGCFRDYKCILTNHIFLWIILCYFLNNLRILQHINECCHVFYTSIFYIVFITISPFLVFFILSRMWAFFWFHFLSTLMSFSMSLTIHLQEKNNLRFWLTGNVLYFWIFKLWLNIYNIQFAFLDILSVQFSSIKYIHHVVQPSVSSVQFSHSVVSDSLRPHESQHARPPCPSPTPGVHSNSRPLSQWCHPAISSSVVPFSCPQSLPASESFPMSQLFTWGGQSTGVSPSASVLPMNTQDWSPLGWTGWLSLQSKGLSRVFSNTTVQKHQFFGTQLSSQSNSHIHTWPLEKP